MPSGGKGRGIVALSLNAMGRANAAVECGSELAYRLTRTIIGIGKRSAEFYRSLKSYFSKVLFRRRAVERPDLVRSSAAVMIVSNDASRAPKWCVAGRPGTLGIFGGYGA